MTWNVCIVELFVCIKATPSCIQKKKLKPCFSIWTCMTWPRIPESTFPSKISSHNSWQTAQLSKMLCNNVPLTLQRFEHKHNALSAEFPGEVFYLNLFEASRLFREYFSFIQLKSCVQSASHYFYCFNGFSSYVLLLQS